jgi:hypothetical protein
MFDEVLDLLMKDCIAKANSLLKIVKDFSALPTRHTSSLCVKHYPVPFERRKHIALQKWISLFWVAFVVWALDFFQAASGFVTERLEKSNCYSCRSCPSS